MSDGTTARLRQDRPRGAPRGCGRTVVQGSVPVGRLLGRSVAAIHVESKDHGAAGRVHGDKVDDARPRRRFGDDRRTHRLRGGSRPVDRERDLGAFDGAVCGHSQRQPSLLHRRPVIGRPPVKGGGTAVGLAGGAGVAAARRSGRGRGGQVRIAVASPRTPRRPRERRWRSRIARQRRGDGADRVCDAAIARPGGQCQPAAAGPCSLPSAPRVPIDGLETLDAWSA